MKGVSAVIATILMLMIVIALAGMAYMYMIGMFTTRTARTIDISDAGCVAGQLPSGYYITIKNLDTTTPITIATDLSARLDGSVVTISGCSGTGTMNPGATANCNISAQGGTAGSFHQIRIIGPANSVTKPANC